MMLKHCEGDLTELDAKLSGHRWHCPKCNKHLTSMMLCPECGTRYTENDAWETLYNETAKELNEAKDKLWRIENIIKLP